MSSVFEIQVQEHQFVLNQDVQELVLEITENQFFIEQGVLPGPPGQPGANVILNETPSGVIDGSNTTFTTANNFVPESLCVQVNGLAQKPIDHFITIGSNTFDMNESPQVGDFLLVCYQEA